MGNRGYLKKFAALVMGVVVSAATMCAPVYAAGSGSQNLPAQKQALYQKATIPEGVLYRIPANEIPAWAEYKGYNCQKKFFSNNNYYYYVVSYQDPNNLKRDAIMQKGTENATDGAGKSFIEGFFDGEDLSFKERVKGGLKSAGKTTMQNIAKNTAEASYESFQEEKAGLNKDREFYMCKAGLDYPIMCYKTVPVKNNSNFVTRVTDGYTRIDTSDKFNNKGDRYRYKISEKSRVDMFTGAIGKNTSTNEDIYQTYYYIVVDGLDDHNKEIANYMNEIFGFNFKK